MREPQRWFNMLRCAGVALLGGVLAAALMGAGLARLQYLELAYNQSVAPARFWLTPVGEPLLRFETVPAILAPDRIATTYAQRLNYKFGISPVLMLPQMGVAAALLSWQLLRWPTSRRAGLLIGLTVGSAQAAAALWLNVPIYLAMVILVLMGGVGWMATVYRGVALQSKTP